jgi:hypothetical protein
MKQEKNKIEYFKGEFLHPSLDIKNNIFILGFRFTTKDLKEKNVFIISTNGNIFPLQEEYFDLEGKRYSIEVKKRLLARIEERWDLEELINFIENYNSGKVKVLSIKELFEKIKNLLKKYVELEMEEDYSVISAWVIGTYFFPIFSAYPFLHIKAPKQSGKTQCLNFLKQVCFNAVKAKPTFPALSDTVDSLRGTYLIDQADLLKRKGNEELVEILTDSYKKEGGKRRLRFPEKQGGWKTIEQEAYSPKVFASVGDLPEDLADRCITIPLIRSQRNFPEPSEENENWKEIRGELYKVLLDKFSVIKSTYEILNIQYRQNSKIIGRNLELWLPLETILKYCVEEDEKEKIQKRYSQLYGYTEYEPNELEKEIIEIIYKSFNGSEKIKLRPPEISEEIQDENLWGFWKDRDLTPHQKDIAIGFIIKKFNLSSDKKNTNKGVVYLFEREKVLKIKNLYCKTEENTSDSPLLAIDSKSSAKNGEELRNPNTP